MAEETRNHENSGYEREDLSPKGVFSFLAGLAIFILVVHLGLTGIFHLMESRQKAIQPQLNPLVRTTEADTRKISPDEVKSFAEPRLETDEVGQLTRQRENEEKTLNTYGWVDQKAGVAHIPIDRAMELIAQRGLPTTAQGASVGGKQVSGNGAAAKPKSERKALE